MASFSDLLGVGTPQPQVAAPQMAGITNPAPEAPAIYKPAATPEEIETRKGSWQQLLQNPNIMRALGMMGVQLVQPIQPGQSRLGAFGQALGTGMAAMQAGEFTDFERRLKERQETRKDKESQAAIGASNATTNLRVAQLPGAQAESALAQGTLQSKISAAEQAVEEAGVRIKSAKTAQELKEIELNLTKRRAEIEKSIPDEKIRAAALAKVDAQILAVDEARAKIDETKATAGLRGAQAKEAEADAGVKEVTRDILMKMDPAEQKAFLTKSGKYSATSSAFQQQAETWGSIYDKLPADDPMKKGKTREQFQMHQLRSAKAKDAAEILTKYLANFGDDPGIISGLTELIKQNIDSQRGAPSPGAGVIEWERGPDGKPRRKQTAPAK